MPTGLVLTALEQALTLRQPAPGLVIHADRGSQYTSAPPAGSAEAEALAGYARPGNPYDNTQAEAGWSTLKTELLPQGGVFASLEEARLEVAYYPTPISTLTAATPPSATARPTSLKPT